VRTRRLSGDHALGRRVGLALVGVVDGPDGELGLDERQGALCLGRSADPSQELLRAKVAELALKVPEDAAPGWRARMLPLGWACPVLR
jgi:hypothetical protein